MHIFTTGCCRTEWCGCKQFAHQAFKSSRVCLIALCVASLWESAPLVTHKKNYDGSLQVQHLQRTKPQERTFHMGCYTLC
jgi:hypothetical protein